MIPTPCVPTLKDLTSVVVFAVTKGMAEPVQVKFRPTIFGFLVLRTILEEVDFLSSRRSYTYELIVFTFVIVIRKLH